MTREELIKAATMRIDGYTYQEIAKEMNFTKQNVHQCLKAIVTKKEHEIPRNVVYRNLYREIRRTYGNLAYFCEVTGKPYRRIYDLCTGRVKVLLDEAVFLSELLNKDIDYLFTRKEM